MDKIKSKEIFQKSGIVTPGYKIIRTDTPLDREAAALEADFGLPLVIKHPQGGSSIDMAIPETAGDLRKALETLWHEFLDYYISKTIEPYKEVTNKLIALINEEAYKRKEQVIEAITKLSKAPAERRSQAIDSTEAE